MERFKIYHCLYITFNLYFSILFSVKATHNVQKLLLSAREELEID